MEKDYLKDIEEIKKIMNRSTRFLSLSGVSGILTGLIALSGLYFAHSMVFSTLEPLTYEAFNSDEFNIILILSISIATLISALGLTIYLTVRKTRIANQKAWNKQSKSLVYNLLIPLLTGGLLSLILLINGFITFLAPLSLIFYGMALVNASKFTLQEIHHLGLIEITLGLLAFLLINYSLTFWAIGFGVLHIVYGLLIHRKYSV